MQKVINQNKENEDYSKSTSFFQKFSDFWMLKKRRIALLILVLLANYYHLGTRFKNRVTKSHTNWKTKMERRWAIRYNPLYARTVYR